MRRIGTEHEKFGYQLENLKPIEYEAHVKKLLDALVDRFNWEPMMVWNRFHKSVDLILFTHTVRDWFFRGTFFFYLFIFSPFLPKFVYLTCLRPKRNSLERVQSRAEHNKANHRRGVQTATTVFRRVVLARQSHPGATAPTEKKKKKKRFALLPTTRRVRTSSALSWTGRA